MEITIIDDDHVWFYVDTETGQRLNLFPKSLTLALYGGESSIRFVDLSFFETLSFLHNEFVSGLVNSIARDVISEVPWMLQLVGCKSADEMALKLAVIGE